MPKATLTTPDGAVYVGRVIGGERQAYGKKRIVLMFEKEFEVKGGENHG